MWLQIDFSLQYIYIYIFIYLYNYINVYVFVYVYVVCVCVCVCWSYEQEYKHSNCVSSTRITKQISEYRGNNIFTVFGNILRRDILCYTR